MQNVESNFKCPLCFFVCELHTELVKHYVRNHHKDEQFRVKCRSCNRQFTKIKSLNQHSRRGSCINNQDDDDQNNCCEPLDGAAEVAHNMDQEVAEEICGNIIKLSKFFKF